MRRRTILKGLLSTAGVAATGFRLAPRPGRRLQRQALRLRPGGRRLGPDELLRPEGEHRRRAGDQPLAERDEIREAGNIAYAPFANNAAFFEKYYDRMLVINGVDAQTNSHTVGIVHNWSGRNSEGYPAMSALLAARYGPDLPVAYLSFGDYSDTGGVARYTRLNNADLLRNIARPAENSEDPERRYMSAVDWSAVRARQALDAARQVSEPNLLPGDLRNRLLYQSAFASSEGLTAYADAIPPEEELEQRREYETSSGNEFHSELRRQAQLAVLAFKTGVAVSADLWLGGFDTHATHDPDQAGCWAT